MNQMHTHTHTHTHTRLCHLCVLLKGKVEFRKSLDEGGAGECRGDLGRGRGGGTGVNKIGWGGGGHGTIKRCSQ